MEILSPRQKDCGWHTLIALIIFLIFLSALYIGFHSGHSGSVTAELNADEQAYISSLLSDTSDPSTVIIKSINFGGVLFTDSASIPTLRATAIIYMVIRLKPIDIYGFVQQYLHRDNLVMLRDLNKITVESRSYFWLTGPRKYLEVIFWCLFGVLANLLYAASEAKRNDNFNNNELPVYAAKIFYAPMIGFIIFLSMDKLILTGDVAADSSSVNLLIFSFILGFFSGRAIELLTKIKDILLPGKDRTEEMEAGKVILAGQLYTKDDDQFDGTKTRVVLKSATDDKIISEAFANEDRFYFIKNVPAGVYNISAETDFNGVIYRGDVPGKTLSKAVPVEKQDIVLTADVPLSPGVVNPGENGSNPVDNDLSKSELKREE